MKRESATGQGSPFVLQNQPKLRNFELDLRNCGLWPNSILGPVGYGPFCCRYATPYLHVIKYNNLNHQTLVTFKLKPSESNV